RPGDASMAETTGRTGDDPRATDRAVHTVRLRQQLPIAPTISLTDVAAAVVDVMRRSNGSWLGAHALLRKEFGADQAMLTDSGTSALVLAMRLAVPGGGTIGLPEY